MEIQDIRDAVVIGGLLTLALMLFVFVLIYAFAGYKIWRFVRLLNRLSEDQLRARIDGFNVRGIFPAPPDCSVWFCGRPARARR